MPDIWFRKNERACLCWAASGVEALAAGVVLAGVAALAGGAEGPVGPGAVAAGGAGTDAPTGVTAGGTIPKGAMLAEREGGPAVGNMGGLLPIVAASWSGPYG
jgi:hypothetical protein